MRSLFFSLISLCFANLPLATSAHGQTSIPNPLHTDMAPKAAPATPAIANPAQASGPRSPAQLLMAEDTRACGADWKQRKLELSAKGETWQSFAKTCRAARKAARGV